MQKYYGPSDEETEFQIIDRFSFLQFLGLRAGDDVPDARTIWDFKQLLERDGRDGTLDFSPNRVGHENIDDTEAQVNLHAK